MKKKQKKFVHYSGAVFQSFTWIMFSLMVIYAIFLLMLLLFGLLTSLKSNTDFRVNNNVLGFPNLSLPTTKDYLLLKNYGDIIKGFNTPIQIPAYFSGNVLHNAKTRRFSIPEMLINSLIYVIGGSFFMTIGRFIMGYICSLYKNKVSAVLYTYVLVTMIIPIVNTQPVLLTLLRNTGLYDNFIGNFITKLSFGGMYFLIFYEFFRSLSPAYQEAAEIDGASQLRIMLLIYFPLAAKMFSTVFLIHAIELWNGYNEVLLYLPSHPTITYGVFIASFGQDQDRYPFPQRIAATMLLAVPTSIVFFIFKDRIMGNLSLGGVKE